MTYRSAGAAATFGNGEGDGLAAADTLHEALGDSGVVLVRLIHGSPDERNADDNQAVLPAMEEGCAHTDFPSG